MISLFYIDYYFIFIILFLLLISFSSNRYDLCFKRNNGLYCINLYTIINLTKLAVFFKIICIILLNLSYNKVNFISLENNFNILVSFKLVFFIFLFFYLQYFYYYSKFMT